MEKFRIICNKCESICEIKRTEEKLEKGQIGFNTKAEVNCQKCSSQELIYLHICSFPARNRKGK